MSLETPPPVPSRHALGVIISRSFDNPEKLDELLLPNVNRISHLYTNAPAPGGSILEAFCKEHGITYTVSPATAHAFASTSNVLAQSEFVYIITDGESKVARFAQEQCEAKGIRHRVIAYTPFTHWREKVEKVSEILDAIPEEEVSESSGLKAIRAVVKGRKAAAK